MKITSKKAGKNTPATVQNFAFNSIQDLIQATEEQAPTAPGTKLTFSKFYCEEESPFKEWAGEINNANHYKELLKNGYLPAVEALDVDQVSSGQRYDLTPSISGQFNDIGAYLEGRPECMGEFLEQETNRYLTVYIECSIGYNVKADLLMEKAKTIFNAINQIEAQGTRVKIVMFADCFAKETNQRLLLMVGVKNHEENFIPSLHGLYIGHLATVRAIMYSYLSLYSKQQSIGHKELRFSAPLDENSILLELTDTTTGLKEKLKAA